MSIHPLIERANSKEVNQISGFAKAAATLEIVELCQLYEVEIKASPLRSRAGKSYFVGHLGEHSNEYFGPGSVADQKGRKEEHFATALFNDYGHGNEGLSIEGGGSIRILDYQLPLKASQEDKLIGKVDLLAIDSDEQLTVVELKYLPANASISRADTPLRAFLEGLAYCAFIEADFEFVHKEAEEKFKQPIKKKPPSLIVLSNDYYWKLYYGCNEYETPWTSELQRLASGVKEKLNIPVSFLSLSVPDEPVRYEERKPKFIQPPLLKRAW
jgi:hypothetical protein